ncbi:MAG: phytanoyl-CoA dioxygenase family protein [Pseudomonadota bacterium]
MQYTQLAKQFHKEGYLVIPDFFDLDLMDQMNQLILSHYGMDPEFYHQEEFLDKAQTEVIPWFPGDEGIEEFNVVEQDVRLNKLTTEILGEGWYSDYSMVMFSKQGTKGQAWHQDCNPENPSYFNMNRLVYTMDIDENTGGQTVIVPGSHRLGTLPASTPLEDLPGSIELEPCKGTLVILHGHCWHRVRPVHGRYRVSTNFRSAPGGTPRGITDICVYQNMRYQFSTNSVVEDRLAHQ